jgi:hypothetical protein
MLLDPLGTRGDPFLSDRANTLNPGLGSDRLALGEALK